jgi:hypothetical protein
MSDKVKAAILILSDLHFGADLLREAEIPPLQIPWWYKLAGGSDVRRYIETRCQSHDMDIVIALPRHLKRIVRQISKETNEGRQEFDLYLIMGDLSTFANGGSYSFLQQYLSQSTKAESLRRCDWGKF